MDEREYEERVLKFDERKDFTHDLLSSDITEDQAE